MPELLKEQERVYLLLNKPKGILVTNSDPSNRKTVGELMAGVKERVFPVGRLDMDSRGALIMTNDGELANRLTHPRFGIEKTYIIEVDGRMGHAEVEKLKRGMWLGPERPGGQGATKTDRFHVKLIGRERGRTIMEVRLSEAKNREIRRVMARIGHNVARPQPRGHRRQDHDQGPGRRGAPAANRSGNQVALSREFVGVSLLAEDFHAGLV